VFTARYDLSPYIKQIRFVSKGLIGRVGFFLKIIFNQSSVAEHSNELAAYVKQRDFLKLRS